MKLLIVDDEKIILEKIISIVGNSDLSVSDIYKAHNVDEAIEILENNNPDVIVTDIKMPQRSGLELLEHVHEKYDFKPVILLTGYFDYEYVKSSINSEVFTYLLKPIDDKTLITAIKKSVDKLSAHNKSNQLYKTFKDYFDTNSASAIKKIFENYLFNISPNQNIDTGFSYFGIELTKFRLIAIQSNGSIDDNRLKSEHFCTKYIEDYLIRRFDNSITFSFGNIVFYVWEVKEDNDFVDAEKLLKEFKSLCYDVNKNYFTGVNVGISEVETDIQKLSILRKHTSECLNTLFHSESENLLFYNDMLHDNSNLYQIDLHIQDIISAIRRADSTDALNSLELILSGLQNKSTKQYTNTLALIIANLRFMIYDTNYTFLDQIKEPDLLGLEESKVQQEAENVRKWIRSICKAVKEAKKEKANSLIKSINDYINLNYGNNIGLMEAGIALGRNSSYISRLIKEQTGKNFTQLLTEKRMGEAKRLLKNTNMKIHEIALEVGYTNFRYFNKIFKNTMNMSANDYRKIITTFD